MENYMYKTQNGTRLREMSSDMPEEKLVETAIYNLNLFRKIYADAHVCLKYISICACIYPEIFRKICPELLEPLIESDCKDSLDIDTYDDMRIINSIILDNSLQHIDSPFNTFKKH